MEYYLEEMALRLRRLSMDSLPFATAVTVLYVYRGTGKETVKISFLSRLDYVHPKIENVVTVADLKRCKFAPVFLNALFNVEKYIMHESKEPSQVRRERNLPPMR